MAHSGAPLPFFEMSHSLKEFLRPPAFGSFPAPASMCRRAAAVSAIALFGFHAGAPRAQEPRRVRILTSWFAQADQAGYWVAQQKRLGQDAGIAITVVQGGPKIQTIPQVASGQAEFGIGNADDILLARARGAPVKAIFAHLDHVPYTLVYHTDPAIKAVSDLRGRTVAVNLGFAYWEWTKKRFNLAGMREIPVTGDLSLFRADSKMVQQGYSLYLPGRMKAAGIDVQQFRIPALGYRPYSGLFTTDETIRNSPALVKAAVAAAQKGWQDFVRDPAAIKPFLMGLNQQIPPDVHDVAVTEMIESMISHDLGKIGCMSGSRWKELAGQLKSVGFLPDGFDERQAYDATLTPGC